MGQLASYESSHIFFLTPHIYTSIPTHPEPWFTFTIIPFWQRIISQLQNLKDVPHNTQETSENSELKKKKGYGGTKHA